MNCLQSRYRGRCVRRYCRRWCCAAFQSLLRRDSKSLALLSLNRCSKSRYRRYSTVCNSRRLPVCCWIVCNSRCLTVCYLVVCLSIGRILDLKFWQSQKLLHFRQSQKSQCLKEDHQFHFQCFLSVSPEKTLQRQVYCCCSFFALLPLLCPKKENLVLSYVECF